MAFVVEDGTGLSTATSYIAVADADTYFTDVADATWAAASSASKQAALIKGTRAIDQYGGTNFYGTKSSSTQALEWPRDDAYDAYDFELTGVPAAVKKATCEAALVLLGDADALFPVIEGGSVIEESVAGAVTIRYSEGSSPTTANYTTVTRALRPVLKTCPGTMLVLRS